MGLDSKSAGEGGGASCGPIWTKFGGREPGTFADRPIHLRTCLFGPFKGVNRKFPIK